MKPRRATLKLVGQQAGMTRCQETNPKMGVTTRKSSRNNCVRLSSMNVSRYMPIYTRKLKVMGAEQFPVFQHVAGKALLESALAKELEAFLADILKTAAPARLMLPSVLALSRHCGCSELVVLEVLHQLTKQGYTYDTQGMDSAILLDNPRFKVPPVRNILSRELSRSQEISTTTKQNPLGSKQLRTGA